LAKADTDAQAQAVQSMLAGLGLKRKQELIERNDRLRFQFLQKQKMAAGKARESQINAFLDGVVTADKKMRELVFNAWIKDNATGLGEVPEFPERFKRDAEAPADEDADAAETDLKEATATFKKWIKDVDVELVNVFAQMGPYEFPAKALTAVKKTTKAKTASLDADAAPEGGGTDVGGGVSEAALAEVRQQLEGQLERQKEQYEGKLAKLDDEVTKFKRLLEENKDKRKSELQEAQDKARQELTARQADWQRVETQLRREIADLNKARSEATDKTSKVRDEIVPLRQQAERLEKEIRRAQQQAAEAREQVTRVEEENEKLQDRIKMLESAQQQLVAKEKQLQKFQNKGASVALAASDNLKIWEESLNEQEVKEAFKRTFNLDTIGVSQFEHDEKDLHEVWKKLLTAESEVVDRFFALPFDELHQPSDEFRELVTSFIELKDSLVAREQLAHMLNFVGNRFLSSLKQKV
jgi:myosin heavy subunit